MRPRKPPGNSDVTDRRTSVCRSHRRGYLKPHHAMVLLSPQLVGFWVSSNFFLPTAKYLYWTFFHIHLHGPMQTFLEGTFLKMGLPGQRMHIQTLVDIPNGHLKRLHNFHSHPRKWKDTHVLQSFQLKLTILSVFIVFSNLRSKSGILFWFAFL